jgi:hypothetical protein
MNLRFCWMLPILFVAPLAFAQGGFDTDEQGPTPNSRHVRLSPDSPLPQVEFPFKLRVLYDSTGRYPAVTLSPDMPGMVRHLPAFARFETSQTNDTTVSVAIIITQLPQPPPALNLPIVKQYKHTVLQLIYKAVDTAIFVVHLDTAMVETNRSAPFVKLITRDDHEGRPDARRSKRR